MHADEMWEYIEDNGDDEDCRNLLNCFNTYKEWTKEEFSERISDIRKN